MTKKINCQTTTPKAEAVRVKVIKAPLVDSVQLKQIVFARARAIVL